MADFKMSVCLILMAAIMVVGWCKMCETINECPPEDYNQIGIAAIHVKVTCSDRKLRRQCRRVTNNAAEMIKRLDTFKTLLTCDQCRSDDDKDVELCQEVYNSSLIFCVMRWIEDSDEKDFIV